MATNKDNCERTSILPYYRTKAEEFAKRLHSRLRSLGSQDEIVSTNELPTWPENNSSILNLKESQIYPKLLKEGISVENHETTWPENNSSILNFKESQIHPKLLNEAENHETYLIQDPITHFKDDTKLINLQITQNNESFIPIPINEFTTQEILLKLNELQQEETTLPLEEILPPINESEFIKEEIGAINAETQLIDKRTDLPIKEIIFLHDQLTNATNFTNEHNNQSGLTNQEIQIYIDSGQNYENLTNNEVINPVFAKVASIYENLDTLDDALEDPAFAQIITSDALILNEAQELMGLNGDNVLFAQELTEEILADALDIVQTNTFQGFIDFDGELSVGDQVGGVVNNGFLCVDEEVDGIPRVRRCSSLKTGKTPPGTPAMKKIVRFADVLGLDLADVRTYLDEIPRVPNSAYLDLANADFDDSKALITGVGTQRTLLALFQQPGAVANFIHKVKINQVMLENAICDDPIAFSIKGFIRVRNLDFHKSVHVRYSWDSWASFSDLQATYIEGSCDGFSDKFSFLVYANQLTIGQRIEFAVRFQCKGVQYWDNNGGANYCFQCLPVSNPTPYAPITGLNEQMASFYYLDQSDESPPINPALSDKELTHAAVQEYIMHSLQKHKKTNDLVQTTNKPEVLTLFFVLFISFVFLYVKKIAVMF